MTLPKADDATVAAVELPPHRLVWLDRLEGEVSGGRGFARRVDAGGYDMLSCDADDMATASVIVLTLSGTTLAGRLRLESVGDGWAVRLG